MQFSVTIVMYMKRCTVFRLKNFMSIADHVYITIFGGLGCIWCHLCIGKCVQNFIQKNVVSP